MRWLQRRCKHVDASLRVVQYSLMQDEALLTPQQAADFLNVSIHTLASWRTRDTGARVPWYEVGGQVRYKRSELEVWLMGQRKGAEA